MSSLYSYELDERHIRLVMLDSEIEFSEADWERFDASRKHNSHAKSFSGILPQFQFSIPKNVLYPSLFVGIIFGLSALLYSFVDFKKVNNSSVPISEIPEVKEELKQIDAKVNTGTHAVKKLSTALSSETQTQSEAKVVASSTVQVSNKSSIDSSHLKVSETKPQQAKEEAIVAKEPETKKMVTSQTIEQKPISKPKKKKVVYEELPSINTSTKIIETKDEPELDLK
jgi:hypothetical protein